MAAGNLRIGTAGWSIPAAVADRFAGEGPALQRYARRMNMVEINSSFHRPHKPETYARWAASTPDDFRFAVKVPKLLTHDQRLVEPETGLDRFLSEAGLLGGKLAVILVQSPPNLAFDPAVAGTFFDALNDRTKAAIVCEPRHATWFVPETEAWLSERSIARVAADPARTPGAEKPGGWRGLTYARLHGSPRIYYSAYTPEFLAETAAWLGEEAEVRPTWCVFDNTAGSAALPNALTVRDTPGDERA